MPEKDRKKKYRFDIIFLAIIAAAGAVFALLLLLNAHSGKYLSVNVNGKVVREFELSKDIRYEIKSDSGSNILVIEKGYAYIEDASCPDKLCVNSGRISMSGQSVVCLPNRVVIEIHDDYPVVNENVDLISG